jgi:mono/diheme cytochrome c family protein
MNEGKRSSTTAWIMVALVAIVLGIGVTFLAGFLLGHFTGGTSTTTVAGTETGGGGSGTEEPGAQVFIASGCGNCHTFAAAGTTGTAGPDLNEYLAPDDDAAGIEEMIVDPEAEIAEGYSGGVMPTTYGQTIPKEEMEQLVQFLVKNSPAGGTEEAAAGG